MDTRTLAVGSRVRHEEHGWGRVTFVGADYIGIHFDDAGAALLRHQEFETQAEPAFRPLWSREILPWPDSTFVADMNAASHSPGSHWQAFFDDLSDLLARLPEILPVSLVPTGYGEHRPPPRAEPESWAQGFQLVWPLRTQGLAMRTRRSTEENTLVSLFPFFASGSQHRMRLHSVQVWKSGVEAQITAAWGEVELSFFDTQYLINRIWYEAEREYDFVLTGIAYEAGPAEKHEFQFDRHADELAWMNLQRAQGETVGPATVTVTMDGAAIFLPLKDADIDDYEFRAPVKSVEAFSDWLGQDGWRVRATVMRFGDMDADLDIVITRRAWTGAAPPQPGQDIEGLLWLQAYLWRPH